MHRLLKYQWIFILCFVVLRSLAQSDSNNLMFGVAYYDEYMPYDRLTKDISMMKEAGINVVRIAESTWSTVEPQDNVFNFYHIDRVLHAMHAAGIKVIIGTPTYAVPAWLVKKYPSILATTSKGRNLYGARQNMDITNLHFKFHAERVIRKIVAHVKDHPAIIGYQVDNETKHYNTAGENVQKLFVNYMRGKFGTLDSVNNSFGLDYWSNRINDWADFPSVNGTINASLKAEFEKFQRKLVIDYLAWQTKIVKSYAKPHQFVTQNFDLEWRGYSYGVQPDVDHFASAQPLDIAGIDIYHPTQDLLTGIEISFGGDIARSMKRGQNYFVIETEAQGFPQWVPYLGQLRLQAFSHLASGANMVSYWHWHSIHNSAETYWKGLLSHDFMPNPTYDESKTIGADFKRLGFKLSNLSKNNQVAILFSNEALSAFNAFSFGWGAKENYNDIVRPIYDALYRMNVEVDFIDPSIDFSNGEGAFGKYKMIIVPALYAASDKLLLKLNQFVKNGGHVIYTFKSGFSDENVKVRSSVQPGIIHEACGVTYSQFTIPVNVSLRSDVLEFTNSQSKVHTWMELLTPGTAKVLAYYQHPEWGNYAAITENKFGDGFATYVGCMLNTETWEPILKQALKSSNLLLPEHNYHYPVILKSGTNNEGNTIRYFFNYSSSKVNFEYLFSDGKELMDGSHISKGQEIILSPWGFKIIESIN